MVGLAYCDSLYSCVKILTWGVEVHVVSGEKLVYAVAGNRERGAEPVTEVYQVTLDSPMGLRTGTLRLIFSGGQVEGTLTLLGFDNPVTGLRMGEDRIRLFHQLRSLMTELTCRSDLELTGGKLTGVADTDWGLMAWTGLRTETL